MNLTIKKFLIYASSILIIAVLILNDPRSTIIGEPFNLTNMAMSIAISQIVYNIDGFIGLREVYETLSKIPHSHNYFSDYYNHLGSFVFSFDSFEQIKEYKKIISEKILEAQNLTILDKKNIHTYQNDIGYVLYIILSFILFGINLKSISILFLIILSISSIIFMISFHKNNVYFFLLQTILFSFVIAVISNYGGSVQIASVINQRFLTILAIIPALHLAIVFLNNNFLNFKSIFLSILQLLILIFLCQTRGTALWSILFLCLFYSFWIFKVGLNNFNKYKKNIFSMISFVFLFLVLFNLNHVFIKKNLSNHYNDISITTKHMFWHSLFISLASSPKIHENYVCTDNEFQDLWKVEHRPCGSYPSRYGGVYGNKSEFYKRIFYYRPLDTFGTHAVIKYINENGLDQQLGIYNKNNLSWSLNWPLYESTLKKLYFDIIKNYPLEFLYTHLIIKPIQFIFEIAKSLLYFLNGFNKNSFFIFLIFIASIGIKYFSVSKIKIKKELTDLENDNYTFLIESILFFIFISIGVLSIIFYPSQQSAIPECFIAFVSIILFFLKKRFEHKER